MIIAPGNNFRSVMMILIVTIENPQAIVLLLVKLKKISDSHNESKNIVQIERIKQMHVRGGGGKTDKSIKTFTMIQIISRKV